MTRNEYLRRADAKGYFKVLEVLRKWDPIGVISERNQDEYDSYAAPIVRMLDAGVSVSDLTAHMERIITEEMGFGANTEETRSCAQELVDFWKEWKRS